MTDKIIKTTDKKRDEEKDNGKESSENVFNFYNFVFGANMKNGNPFGSLINYLGEKTKQKSALFENAKTFDDLLLDREKELIRQAEIKYVLFCPYLKKEGDYFYYCSLGIDDSDKKPHRENPICKERVDIWFTDLCTKESYKSECSKYRSIDDLPKNQVIDMQKRVIDGIEAYVIDEDGVKK